MKNQGMKSLRPLSADADQKRQEAGGRSNCYGLLSLIFRDVPTSQVVAQLRSPPIAEALVDLGCDVAEDLAGDVEAVTEHLREEYTRTFVGPGPHVSPYASVHHDGEGRLWGDSTVRTKRFIEAAGLSFEGHWDSIPDHIAIELELMQRLTAHEAELWAQLVDTCGNNGKDVTALINRCLQVQERFLRDHLCKWAPQFCDKVSDKSGGSFYREIAGLTKRLILADDEELAAALADR